MNWLGRFRKPQAAVDETRWVVLDVETSGLDAGRDRLLAVAAIAMRVDWGRKKLAIVPGDSFEVVLRQHEASEPDNILLHGIGAQRQRSGVPASEALRSLRDYAGRRRVFGRLLREQPLHHDTMAGLQAEFEAGLHFALYVAELLGRAEHGMLGDHQRVLLRLLVPIVKLMTRSVVTMAPDDPLRHAIDLIVTSALGALPVVSSGRLVGIWSVIDIARAFGALLDDGGADQQPDSPPVS